MTNRIKYMISKSQMNKQNMMDHIATIFVDDSKYFDVFRRYDIRHYDNRRYDNPYNIVIQDYNEDIYIRKNQTIRESLMDIMCLTEHTIHEKTNTLLDMYWTDIHEQYRCITLFVTIEEN